ncbi:hypothetical protein DdX_16972 [Ditylenchus destructor]|uniref:Uncharacterized protein n=1 Tax=Ditylenchus destructor TaxID=166010 RepID=A0AAD4QTP9_9BILA|nr:hypothetical protein DdX_16972 [Ditylenchus destructor]
MSTHLNSDITDAPPQTNEDVNKKQDRNASNKRTSFGTYTNGKDSKTLSTHIFRYSMQFKPNSPTFAIYHTGSYEKLKRLSHTSARLRCHPTWQVTKKNLARHPRRPNTSSAKLLKPCFVLMKPTYFNVLPVTISMARYFMPNKQSDDTQKGDPTEINDAPRNMCHGEEYAAISTESSNMPASTVPNLPNKSCSCNHYSNQPSTSRYRHAEYGYESSVQNRNTLRERELLTESYGDNRTFSIFHERIDDSSQEAGNRTKFHSVEAYKQMYMDELLLRNYGFPSCSIKAKFSANVKKIWDEQANHNFVETAGKQKLRQSQCFNLRAFRAYPKYRYSKFGF